MLRSLRQIPLLPRSEPLVIAWPSPEGPASLMKLDDSDAWREFIESMSLTETVPLVVRTKFARAQALYLLGWIDLDLVKAGELIALTALELAVKDRYWQQSAKQNSFAQLLQRMIEVDGLGDTDIPIVARYGHSAIGCVSGDTKPSLAQIRNAMAHGDPFDALPTSGLLELVRDLINFAYRSHDGSR